MSDVSREWQRIETAPTDGTRIMLLLPETYKNRIWIGYYNHSQHYTNGALDFEKKHWVLEGIWHGMAEDDVEPIKWMSLPPAYDNA